MTQYATPRTVAEACFMEYTAACDRVLVPMLRTRCSTAAERVRRDVDDKEVLVAAFWKGQRP